jgi:hypothetical protein
MTQTRIHKKYKHLYPYIPDSAIIIVPRGSTSITMLTTTVPYVGYFQIEVIEIMHTEYGVRYHSPLGKVLYTSESNKKGSY